MSCYLYKNSPVTWTNTWTELIEATDDSLNLVQKEENISWNVAETIVQHKISFKNFEPEGSKTACNFKLKCDKNKGRIKWMIKNGVKILERTCFTWACCHNNKYCKAKSKALALTF